MQCVVYKSGKKMDTYLFVEKEGEFNRVPDSLLAILGNLELVMSVDLDAREKLAQADPQQVKDSLIEQGYFLQLPPTAYISGSA
jgi:uncharacterized protein